MSKGTPIVGVRIPPTQRAEVEAVIAHRNANSREAPWTLSDFVVIALREKIAKMARCRRRKLDVSIGQVLQSCPPLPHRQPTLFDAKE